MMWTSEEILQATIDVFMDKYGATLVDLGPTGADIDLSISAAVVAYEAGADPDHVEAAFGVSGWIITARHDSPYATVIRPQPDHVPPFFTSE